MPIKKIAYISFIKDAWGGSEHLWYLSAKEAIAQKIKVVVSSIDVGEVAPPLIDLKAKGAKLHLRRGFINPAWSRNLRLFHKIKYAILNFLFNPFRAVIKEKPDCIVFTGAAYAILLNKQLYTLIEKYNIPLILNIQVNIEYTRPLNDQEALFLKQVYTKASGLIFVSERNKQVAERHLAMKINNSNIICNPVNLNSSEIVNYPKTSQIRFAIVANLLVNHKGHDILLEVLSKEKWKQRSIQLHIYGNGFDKNYINQLVSYFDLESFVFFHGKVNDIRKVWEENHILVMPSLNEGMALAVIEAMICGRPVVTTDVGGNSEWITDNVNGFIADGANVNSFDNALERAWNRRIEWEIIGKMAHESATKKHDPESGKTFLKFILNNGDRS